MIIGERVKKARLERNLSQQELGDLLGVTKVSVCGYETGSRTPTLETFLDIMETLNLEPDYLLGRDNNVVNEQNVAYGIKLSDIDIKIIKSLKKDKDLYKMLANDPERTLELINRKINK